MPALELYGGLLPLPLRRSVEISLVDLAVVAAAPAPKRSPIIKVKDAT
jgi:hypothetical protein